MMKTKMELESQISDMRERLEEEEGTSASLSATKRKLEGELSDLKRDLEGLETTLAKMEKEKQVGRPLGQTLLLPGPGNPQPAALQGPHPEPIQLCCPGPEPPATCSYFNLIQYNFKSFLGQPGCIWRAQ